MENPRLSILMPVFNGEKYLAQTLDSVFGQTFADWEIVMMDGGSKDNTVAIAKKYAARDPRILVHSEPDEGPYHAIHKALAVARGEFVCILCASDGYLEKRWLELCVGALEKDQELSLVWGIPFDITEDGAMKGSHFMYAHFLAGSSARGPFFKEMAKRLLNPSSFIRLMKKINFSTLSVAKHVMSNDEPPAKQEWFKYWLKTGTVFPDGNMCLAKNVLKDCLPPYTQGTREAGDWMQFFFNVNARGYLSLCIPIPANFSRNDQQGSVTKRFLNYNDTIRERYYKNLADLRKKLEKHPEEMVFRDRTGKVLS